MVVRNKGSVTCMYIFKWLVASVEQRFASVELRKKYNKNAKDEDDDKHDDDGDDDGDD